MADPFDVRSAGPRESSASRCIALLVWGCALLCVQNFRASSAHASPRAPQPAAWARPALRVASARLGEDCVVRSTDLASKLPASLSFLAGPDLAQPPLPERPGEVLTARAIERNESDLWFWRFEGKENDVFRLWIPDPQARVFGCVWVSELGRANNMIGSWVRYRGSLPRAARQLWGAGIAPSRDATGEWFQVIGVDLSLYGEIRDGGSPALWIAKAADGRVGLIPARTDWVRVRRSRGWHAAEDSPAPANARLNGARRQRD
jgi:hypothetical protein